MAFIYIFFLKRFEKVEKTRIISTKFSLRCTPSVILGVITKKMAIHGWSLILDLQLQPTVFHNFDSIDVETLPLKYFNGNLC